MYQHRAVEAHFNGPSHKVSEMAVTILVLEKVWSMDPIVLAVREEFWIQITEA